MYNDISISQILFSSKHKYSSYNAVPSLTNRTKYLVLCTNSTYHTKYIIMEQKIMFLGFDSCIFFSFL